MEEQPGQFLAWLRSYLVPLHPGLSERMLQHDDARPSRGMWQLWTRAASEYRSCRVAERSFADLREYVTLRQGINNPYNHLLYASCAEILLRWAAVCLSINQGRSLLCSQLSPALPKQGFSAAGFFPLLGCAHRQPIIDGHTQ